MKRITCIDATIEIKVRAMLARYGMLEGFYHIGPSPRDPTIQLVLTTPIDPAMESTIRHELESIGGALSKAKPEIATLQEFPMFAVFSSRLGCIGSLILSLVVTAMLYLLLR